MMARIYGLVQNSYVDGPGIRMAIFFQGCLKHCKGCHNPGAWEPCHGVEMDTEELKRRMAIDPLLQGITLSGGEPLLQPEVALELAKFAHSLGLNVWCYTGYEMEDIVRSGTDSQWALVTEADVVVDGAYIESERSLDLKWRGSRNQRLIDVKKSLEAGEVIPYSVDTF